MWISTYKFFKFQGSSNGSNCLNKNKINLKEYSEDVYYLRKFILENKNTLLELS